MGLAGRFRARLIDRIWVSSGQMAPTEWAMACAGFDLVPGDRFPKGISGAIRPGGCRCCPAMAAPGFSAHQHLLRLWEGLANGKMLAVNGRTHKCAACSRFLQPSRSPDAWSPQGRARIRPLLPALKSPRLQTRIHRLLLLGLKSPRRRRGKPWSGSRDVGIGTAAGMFGSAVTTSSALSGGIGKRGIGRGTAVAGDGLAAAGASEGRPSRF
jgi:hypothetical protein